MLVGSIRSCPAAKHSCFLFPVFHRVLRSSTKPLSIVSLSHTKSSSPSSIPLINPLSLSPSPSPHQRHIRQQQRQTTSMVTTLVVATTCDPASINPANALLGMPSWQPGPHFQDDMKSYVNEGVRVLLHGKSIVVEDDLDKRWEEITGEVVDEVIFFSKHTAVSNKPALTVHPIGVPHLREGDVPPQGGKPGWAALPNPRMGPWLRHLRKLAQAHNLVPEFEITLEATHHGPLTNKPTMFLEIGGAILRVTLHRFYDPTPLPAPRLTLRFNNLVLNSYSSSPFVSVSNNLNLIQQLVFVGSTEDYWKRQDAAQVMAQLVWEGLGLGGGADLGNWSRENDKKKVLLGIGGGHYAPRHMDVVLKDDVWVGHLLSGYSLPMEDINQSKGETNVEIGGTWRESIKAAYEATKSAFPGGEIIAHLDHKSFKGWQKNAITGFLAEQNIKIGKPNNFIEY